MGSEERGGGCGFDAFKRIAGDLEVLEEGVRVLISYRVGNGVVSLGEGRSEGEEWRFTKMRRGEVGHLAREVRRRVKATRFA